MDIFFTQSSPLSDASSSSSSIYASAPALAGGFHSHHEEILLATSRPKKRAGRKIFKETRHPVYRGVRKRNVNKWVCELREPNKKSRIWLGTYPTPEMAARAHDVAALALRGKSACLNFADSAWRLPVPASADAREIRRVSGEAAELFRPQEFGGRDQNSAQNVCSEEDSSEEFENSRENALFIDEEEVFDMPRLLAEMAEGLLLSPPFFDGDGTTSWNLLENDFNVSLWSY